MNRRSFLLGLSAVAAPAVITSGILMPLRGIIMPVTKLDIINNAVIDLLPIPPGTYKAYIETMDYISQQIQMSFYIQPDKLVKASFPLWSK